MIITGTTRKDQKNNGKSKSANERNYNSAAGLHCIVRLTAFGGYMSRSPGTKGNPATGKIARDNPGDTLRTVNQRDQHFKNF